MDASRIHGWNNGSWRDTQAVKDVADELNVMAVSEDGLVKAVELPEKRFVWAVQWHPEFSYRVDDNSKLIFREFVKHCQEL